MTHQVALYALDWENAGRSERVDAVDPATGSVLDSRTVSSFVGGQYLVYNVTGHVQFRITNVAGVNAVLNGIFLDATPSASVPHICEKRHIYAGQLGELIWRTGLQHSGRDNQHAVVCVGWIPIR